MLESADLIRRFHSGDSGVFESVIEDHQEDIYTLCLRSCGDINHAERLAEQIFLAAHQALYRLAPDTSLRPWLLRLAINLLEEVEPLDSVDDPPEEQQSALVNDVLQQLDTPFRFAVMLRDVLEISESDVADILNLPLGTVRSRIHRGRLTMARSLAKELE